MNETVKRVRWGCTHTAEVISVYTLCIANMRRMWCLELSSSGTIWEQKVSCGTQASFAFVQLKLPQASRRSFHLGSGEHECKLKRLYLHQKLKKRCATRKGDA